MMMKVCLVYSTQQDKGILRLTFVKHTQRQHYYCFFFFFIFSQLSLYYFFDFFFIFILCPLLLKKNHHLCRIHLIYIYIYIIDNSQTCMILVDYTNVKTQEYLKILVDIFYEDILYSLVNCII